MKYFILILFICIGSLLSPQGAHAAGLTLPELQELKNETNIDVQMSKVLSLHEELVSDVDQTWDTDQSRAQKDDQSLYTSLSLLVNLENHKALTESDLDNIKVGIKLIIRGAKYGHVSSLLFDQASKKDDALYARENLAHDSDEAAPIQMAVMLEDTVIHVGTLWKDISRDMVYEQWASFEYSRGVQILEDVAKRH
jgi:hypothetical protein